MSSNKRRAPPQLWIHPGSNEQFWVDENGSVICSAITGNFKADVKLQPELMAVRALLRAWGWPASSTVRKQPEGNLTAFDFLCRNDHTSEEVAIEVKAIMWPSSVIRGLIKKRRASLDLGSFQHEVARLTSKADAQLSEVNGRRVVLLVWQYEREATLLWQLFCDAARQIDVNHLAHVDDIWVTTPHFGSAWNLQGILAANDARP